MKQLKLAVMSLITMVILGKVSAQDSDNPWAVSFGVNIVDFYQTNDLWIQTKDWGGQTDWQNILPSISHVSVERYLGDGFSLQFAGTVNEIRTRVAVDDTSSLYWSIASNVKYDLNNLMGDTTQWFDPFFFLGGAFVDVEDSSEGMLNVGFGFNTWFNDNLGLSLQTGTTKNFADKVDSHFRHSLGLVIKFGGLDTDGDGVYDKNDECPEVAGLEEFNGCPDSDGDGVKDSDDACPDSAGTAEMNGCPDSDEDGIPDKDDMCPSEKGTIANNGCPDSDGDGVVDKDDKCVDVVGPFENGGCPWPDTDGDGVLDKDDNCKNEVGSASNEGCPLPVITIEAENEIGEYARKLFFKVNAIEFKKEIPSKLDAIAEIMKEFPKAKFVISGHADSTGSESYNQKLSEKRSQFAKDYLVEKGIDETRLTTEGYGESKPIASNKNRKGRAENRRVEITVTNKEE